MVVWDVGTGSAGLVVVIVGVILILLSAGFTPWVLALGLSSR